MDPELLKLLLSGGGANQSVPVAAQDVTSVATPFNRPVPQGEGTPGQGNMLANIIQGLDPSMGLLSNMAGIVPDEPSPGLQMGAGLASMGMPGGAVKVGAKSIKGMVTALKNLSFDMSVAGRRITDPKGTIGQMSRRAFRRTEVIDDPKRLVGKGLGFLERGIDDVSVALAETDDLFNLVDELEDFGNAALIHTDVALPGLDEALEAGVSGGRRELPRPRFTLAQEKARDQVMAELVRRAERAPRDSEVVTKVIKLLGLSHAPKGELFNFTKIADGLSNSAAAIDLLLKSTLKQIP